MKILGISAKSKNGKDTIANYLIEKGFQRVAFADPLKTTLSVLVNEPLEHFHTQEGKEMVNQMTKIKNRILLQAFGEVMRNDFPEAVKRIADPSTDMSFFDDHMFWVNTCLSVLKSKPDAKYVISDVRYPNEVEAIKAQGGVVIRHFRRDWIPDPELEKHHSETALDGYTGFDRIATTASIEQMYRWIDWVLEHYALT